MISSTNKMILRRWNKSDAEFLFALNSDPNVLLYTGDSPFWSVAEAEKFIAHYNHYTTFGYGRWICELKSTGEAVGWAGLKNQMKSVGIIDIGFRFLKNYWNKGLATEAAEECLKLGFETFGITEITGRAAVENIYSGKVLQRIGMTKLPKVNEVHGHKMNFYSLNHLDYGSLL
ncbi:MAG: GNAT family N-acetyltransferase [Flavobacteriales bacterium]